MSSYQKNKTAMGIALLGLLPIIIIVVLISMGGKNTMLPLSKEGQWKYVREYTDKLNNRNADIIFYKHAPNGPDNLRARRLNGLAESAVEDPYYSTYTYKVIILYDLDDSLTLDSSELSSLNNYLKKGYRIIYLGTKLYPSLRQAGIISSVPEEGTKSLIVFYNNSNVKCDNAGFAEKSLMLPANIPEDISPEQEVVFNMVMELAQKDLFWS